MTEKVVMTDQFLINEVTFALYLMLSSLISSLVSFRASSCFMTVPFLYRYTVFTIFRIYYNIFHYQVNLLEYKEKMYTEKENQI